MAHDPAGPPDPGPTDPRGDRVLVIRTWRDDGVRARLLSADDADAAPAPLGVADGVDDICGLVRSWLADS